MSTISQKRLNHTLMALHGTMHCTAREYILYNTVLILYVLVHTVEIFYCKFTVKYVVCVKYNSCEISTVQGIGTIKIQNITAK